jgi:uncharacterized lipoprotein NlpE involved in copper resistance
MCNQLSHKLCIAQDVADRTGLPQALELNAIGSYNLVPAHQSSGDVMIVVNERHATHYMSDELANNLASMTSDIAKRKVRKTDVIQAAYALGHYTAEKTKQREIDALKAERANMVLMLADLKAVTHE